MANYIVKISNHEYGTREKEYRIAAGNFGTAAGRAWREIKKEKALGRKRLREIIIKIIRI